MKFTDGIVVVDFGDTLENMASNVATRADGDTDFIARQVVSEVFADGQGKWPVKSGFSKSQLTLDGLAIWGKAPYTGFIWHGNAWKSLIRDPLVARREELAKLIGRSIISIAIGGN